MKMTVILIVIGTFDTDTKRLLQCLGDLEIRGRVETIQTYSIVEHGKNTEKSPGDLKRLAISQTPVVWFNFFV